MTKKLFVVLVVATAMLVSFSLLWAANKLPTTHQKDQFEKPVYSGKQTAQPVSRIGTSAPQRQAELASVSGRTYGAIVPVDQPAVPLVENDKLDFCDLYGSVAYAWENLFWGLEYYANFQEPYDYGCTDVFPFELQGMQFNIQVQEAITVNLRFIVFANAGTDCPIPGDELYTTETLTFEISEAGHWYLYADFDEPFCVYEPFFAGVELLDDYSGMADRPDAIVSNDGLMCQSYNNYNGTWYDMGPDGMGGPGMLLLSAYGYTRPQNTCTEEPVCCQFDGYCDSMTPTACIEAGGTPAPDTRYECIDDFCILPWEAAGCEVASIEPLRDRVAPGGEATFTVTVEFIGSQTECLLSADPDPACTDCGTAVFDPNPVVSPATTSTMTIQTAETTPAGRYEVTVNGAKATAYVEVVEPGPECDLRRDWAEGSYWYYDGWVDGEQNALLLDPGTWCVGCDGSYPFYLQTIKGVLKNHAGLSETEVGIHLYEVQSDDPCLGPGAEFYSFQGTVNVWSWDIFELQVPDRVCINGPFFLSIEYLGTTGEIPSLLWDRTQAGDPCEMWDLYEGSWYNWDDVFGMEGYFTIWAVGTCDDPYCAPGNECNMQQDNGTISSLGTFWGTGWKEAKYYDPEEFCTAPVYPYLIQSVDLGMYDYYAVGSGDYQVGIYLECSDPCDGPGTQIYLSPTVTFNSGFPAFYTVDLPDPVCVYEPFFVSLECEAPASSAPQLLYDDQVLIPVCHNWFYDAVDSPPWIEHYDFWLYPDDTGMPMIRVSGSTENGLCDPPACDTTIEQLKGAMYATSYWKTPPNDHFLNMKFEMPLDHSGRLEYFEWAAYAGGTTGTPDVDFYVWLSDGFFPLDNNPPYQAIADFHVAFEDLIYYSSWNRIYTYDHYLIFEPGEMFHIGFDHAWEAGDTLSPLSDDGLYNPASQRWSGWYNSAWEDYWPYEMLMDAYICPFPVEGPTFTMKCTPTLGYATPGDPPTDVFEIDLISVIGYAENITLSLIDITPLADITVGFTPNGVPCPYTSTVDVTVDPAVSYGNYTLTFQAVGGDAQTKTCTVTLTVQPPYDEGIVNFYHGFQRSSNFGAVANGDLSTQNFSWYGITPLYDGSIISLADIQPYEDHIALDLYDCVHVGFVPTEHMVITHDPWCAGSSYEEDYGEVAYSHFYVDESVIPGEYDSVFVIGLSDVECTDFSIKIKIYYNPTDNPSPEIYSGIFEDWDIGDDWATIDPVHNMIYMYDDADPSIVFGIMSVPFYDQNCHNIVSVYNVQEVYPDGAHSVSCGVLDGPQYLAQLMMTPGVREPGFWGEGADDHSVLLTSPPFVLGPNEQHIEIWIDFGRNLIDELTWEQWYHNILRYAGFYRGDVDASDTLDLPALDVSDLVYLINYLYQDGPAPIPFADQGDVDGKGPYSSDPCDGLDVNCPKNNVDVQDLVYLLNYIYKDGPPPVDRVRFIEQCWSRPSLFLNPDW